jgi:hypothetical protein
MTRVIADTILRKHFGDFHHQVELCDESGQTVGFFVPCLPQFKPPADIQSPYSPEELRRRAAEPGAKPLSEVWPEIRGQ